MTKVLYHGKEIDLVDTLEPGEEEFDLITDPLEDTIEFDINSFKETINNNDVTKKEEKDYE